jgi:hypothetical protein
MDIFKTMDADMSLSLRYANVDRSPLLLNRSISRSLLTLVRTSAHQNSRVPLG